MMRVEPVGGKPAVFVNTVNGAKALMVFDNEEEAFLDMLERLTELAQIVIEESDYTLPEIYENIRLPVPEDHKYLPEDFEPTIVCKLDYDTGEYDLIAFGRVMR